MTFPVTNLYTTPGPGTETVPEGATSVVIEGWGGGGGGSGIQSDGGGGNGAGGGNGGGSGSYFKKTVTVSGGQTFSYVVGAGGAGGTGDPAVAGSTGGITTVSGNGVNCLANGGLGAGTADVADYGATDGTACAAGTGGDVNTAGASGTYGLDRNISGTGNAPGIGGAAVAGDNAAYGAGGLGGIGSSYIATSGAGGGVPGGNGAVSFTYSGTTPTGGGPRPTRGVFVGDPSGNLSATALWLGTSSGNVAVLAGWVGDPSGNLQFWPPGSPPVTSAVSLTVAENAAATNVPLSIAGAYTAVSVPGGDVTAHGTITPGVTTIAYQPDSGYSGPDSFTYTASNAFGTSNASTVSVTVTPAPVTLGVIVEPGGVSTVANSGTTGIPETVTVSGGTAPYTVTWSWVDGPGGPSVASVSPSSATGSGPFHFTVAFSTSVTGAAGQMQITANVTDSLGNTGSATYTQATSPD